MQIIMAMDRAKSHTSSLWFIGSTTIANNAAMLTGIKKPDDCNTDDEFVFYTNYVVQYRSSQLKCDSDDPDIEEGNWSLSNDEQIITINIKQLERDSTIDLLTSEKLKVTTKEWDMPVTITFSAKK